MVTFSGSLVAWEGGIDLVLRRPLPFERARVWAAIVEPESTARWFGRWRDDEAAPAGNSGEAERRILIDGDGGGESSSGDDGGGDPATVLECRAPELLLLAFGDEEFSWSNGVTLEAAEAGTVLTLTHGLELIGGEVDASALEAIGPGWEFYLDRLEAFLGGHPEPGYDDYPNALAQRYLDLAEAGPED